MFQIYSLVIFKQKLPSKLTGHKISSQSMDVIQILALGFMMSINVIFQMVSIFKVLESYGSYKVI